MGEICQAFIKRACHIFLIRLEMIILTKGKFSDLHFFDSLMDIHIKRKTGKLNVRTPKETGVIYFENGSLIDASTKHKQSREAFFTILGWTDGEYDFQPTTESPTKTINDNLHNLILDFVHHCEKNESFKQCITHIDNIIKFNYKAVTAEEKILLQPKEWKTLYMVNEHRSIKQLSTFCHHNEKEMCAIIYGLISSGILEMTENKENEESLPIGVEEKENKTSRILRYLRQLRDALFHQKIDSSDRIEPESLFTSEGKRTGIMVMADFINQFIDEYELKEGRDSVFQSLGKHKPLDLVPILTNQILELKERKPALTRLLSIANRRLDISRAEAKTSLNGLARTEIRQELSVIIKRLFEKTVEEIGERDAIFRYNKVYRKVFPDNESPAKFGVDGLIDKKL